MIDHCNMLCCCATSRPESLQRLFVNNMHLYSDHFNIEVAQYSILALHASIWSNNVGFAPLQNSGNRAKSDLGPVQVYGDGSAVSDSSEPFYVSSILQGNQVM